jgi:hypothetical protein
VTEYETRLIESGPGGQLVHQARSAPCLLYNASETNNIYLCDSYSFTPGNADTNILRPLGTLVPSGETDTWAMTLPGQTATLEISPATQSTPAPSDIAQQILTNGGIPPVDNPQALNNSPVFNQIIAAGGSYTSPHMTVLEYQSVFGKLFCSATSAGTGTNPYCDIEFNWSIASDGYDPLRTEDWIVPNTPYNFTYNYINQWASPCWGDTLTITVNNLDTEPVELTYGLFGSYRTRIRSTMRGLYNTIATPTAGLGSDNVVLAYSVPALGIGATSGAQLMNLWEGPVTVSLVLPGVAAAGADVYILMEPNNSFGFAVQPQYRLEADAKGIIQNTGIILPRRVCLAEVANGTGAAFPSTGALLIIGEVQPE